MDRRRSVRELLDEASKGRPEYDPTPAELTWLERASTELENDPRVRAQSKTITELATELDAEESRHAAR